MVNADADSLRKAIAMRFQERRDEAGPVHQNPAHPREYSQEEIDAFLAADQLDQETATTIRKLLRDGAI
jgi:hypothetical protein